MKNIIDQLEKITRDGYSHYDVFRDWIDLMLYTLMTNDDKYLEVVRRYKNNHPNGEREIDYFANAFSLLMNEMRNTNDEQLGSLYMAWSSNNKSMGQFFTPKHIASVMGQLNGNLKGKIYDPACGSGIMLIEACKLMNREDLENSIFIGQDLDLLCVKMCALNLTFFNLNGYVIYGDTLMFNDYRNVFQTTRTPFGGAIRELSGEEIPEIKPVMVYNKSKAEA